MGYEIRTLNDNLSGHAFQINGAIALKNYDVSVDGTRLKITSTQNAVLSLLEAEVSEIDINGKIYDNAIDAQNALRSIIYADLPIVVLTTEEKKKIILKTSELDPNASKLLKGDGTYTELPDLSTKADKTAENLEAEDVEKWREKLNITPTATGNNF